MIALQSNQHTLTAYSCFVNRSRHVLTTLIKTNENFRKEFVLFFVKNSVVTYPCAPVPSNSSVNLYLSLNDISEYESAVRRFFFFCLFWTLFIGELSDLHPALVVSRRTSSWIKLEKKRNNNNNFIFLFYYLPGGFDTFNDDGRFICGRPTFSVAVVNIVDVDGLLFAESSFEWIAPVFNSSSL